MTTLYDLQDEYLGLIESLENDELDEAQAFELIQKTKGEIKEKAINIGFVIKNTKASADIVDAEIKRLQDKKKAYENKVSRLNSYLLFVMTKLNIAGFKDPIMTISKCSNSQPSVVISNEALIPDCYKSIETVVKIDKKAIARDFAETPIDGVTVTKGEHVRVG